MKKQEIKVVVVDDHDLIRQGLKRLIDFEKDIQFVGEVDNGENAMSMINDLKPDVLLLDMKMPVMNGLDVLKKVRENKYNIKVLMLTIEDDKKTIKEAINIGADGYLLKDSAGKEVVDAIHAVYRGDKYIDKSLVSILFSDIRDESIEDSILDTLTNREIDVLYYLSRGMSNKEIGEKLYLSEKTVKNYMTRLFKKVNLNDRVHATIFALKNDIDEYYKNKISK